MALIKQAGVKTVVTACADGYQAFKVLYDKFHLKGGLEVLHISEYVDRLINEGKLKLRKKNRPLRSRTMTLAVWADWASPGCTGKERRFPGDRFVFDPPKTYRRGTHGVYQPPRDVLQSIPGIKLTEMARIKEYAWCCGAGGGVSESNPEFAQWTAQERIEEAASTGAEALVTACPWCEKTFNKRSRKPAAA